MLDMNVSTNNKIIKNFIVFEGLDGAGTTTQTLLLGRNLKIMGVRYRTDCEPTEGFIGKTIRKVLKGEETVAPGTLAKLFAADRHEHLYNEEKGILTLCKKGIKVISDRYLFSSLAYQSLKFGFDNVFKLNMEFPLPEHLFYLEVPEEICQARLSKRKELEIFEDDSIQKTIKENYKKAIGCYSESGMNLHPLDGTLPPDELGKIVWSQLTL